MTFPASAPVSRFVEKTALRYRLKDTKYIFEIARYDEYSRAGLEVFQRPGSVVYTGQMSEVPSTSWGASIFHPDWDNLLGDHANLPVGRSAQWNPKLDTFFPPLGNSSSGDGYSGFWVFIHLVRQVAYLLSSTKTSPLQQVPRDTTAEIETSSTKAEVARSQASSSANEGKNLNRLLDGDLGTLF